MNHHTWSLSSCLAKITDSILCAFSSGTPSLPVRALLTLYTFALENCETGAQRFPEITSSCYRGAYGIIVVYDVTDNGMTPPSLFNRGY